MTRRSWIAVGLAFSLTETSCFGFQVMQPACFFSKRSALNMAADLPEMQDIPSMEPFAHDTPKVTTTEIQDGVNITTVVSDDDLLPLAPPLTFDKFITMQDKRVVVTIRYSGDSGLKPYYLTVAKKLKASHPDVLIEKRILSAVDGDNDLTFEILVDGKVIVGNRRSRKQRFSGVNEVSGGKSVYISMQELDLAISKARRKRRPSTLYGEENSSEASVRLEMLRRSPEEGGPVKKHDHWDD